MHFAADISLTSVAGALQYRTVAARGAMLFFLLNSLNKIHAFYQYSLNAFVTVFSRAIDVAPGKQTVLICPALHSMFKHLRYHLRTQPQRFKELACMLSTKPNAAHSCNC